MFARLVAWSIVVVVLAGVWHYGSNWHSPWDIRSPVISQLPAAAPGCGEGCK